VQLSPFSHHLIPLRTKYSHQHPVLKHPLSMLFRKCQSPSFLPIQNNWQNYGVLYFNLYVPRHEAGRIKTELNGSKRSPNLVCCSSLCARNIDLLVLLPDILTLPDLQRTCSLYLSYALLLSSDYVTLTYD
jgi:hypothetical protein